MINFVRIGLKLILLIMSICMEDNNYIFEIIFFVFNEENIMLGLISGFFLLSEKFEKFF